MDESPQYLALCPSTELNRRISIPNIQHASEDSGGPDILTSSVPQHDNSGLISNDVIPASNQFQASPEGSNVLQRSSRTWKAPAKYEDFVMWVKHSSPSCKREELWNEIFFDVLYGNKYTFPFMNFAVFWGGGLCRETLIVQFSFFCWIKSFLRLLLSHLPAVLNYF